MMNPIITGSDHYETDVLLFFDGRLVELSLYYALFERMEAAFPEASVKVQKSQISFYNRHLFAVASPWLWHWTHHVLVPGKGQIDGGLLGWLWEACEFVESKR